MTYNKLKRLLERQNTRIDSKITRLKVVSSRFSRWRFIVFGLGALYAFFVYGTVNDYIYMGGLIAIIALFIVLVDRHYKVHQAIEKFGHLKEIKKTSIARMDLNWDEIPEAVHPKAANDHPFSGDLNIVGEQSLHHLIDTSIYDGSSRLLADWLLKEHPETAEVTKRQNLVKELIPLQILRDKISVIGNYSLKHVSDKDWTMEQLLKWLRLPRKMNFVWPLTILSLLSIANIVLALMTIAGVIGPYFLITFITYLAIYNFNSHKITGLYDAAYQTDKLLKRFGKILLYVENFNFRETSMLGEFTKVFKDSDEKPSAYLKKVSKLAGAASLQKNQVLWPLVNMVIPWDMYFSMKMEKLKGELEPKLSKWLDTFYEIEALNSLANFAYLNPEYTFATIREDNNGLLFEAEGLGHPLIPKSEKVSNDFSIKKGEDLFLITGSNMAGKSTFLRTVGINLCLSFAGAPVSAKSLRTELFRLFTSINVKDDLGGGLSHFYAEVKRLKRLLEELNKEDELRLFFFVDEIFKGTNNRERFQGSTAFLKEVAGKNGVGMVSTHDLELASLEDEIPQLSNWHFVETIENDKMSFEYKLRSGPCPTTNALRIMEIEGLPVK